MKKDNEIRPIEYSNRAIKNAVAFGVLIRVFLLEQIFRSFKIINGETYHR